MASTTRLLTYDDLESIPQEREGDRHELIGGMLYVTPSPIPVHELITMGFVALALPIIGTGDLGWFFTAPVDVKLTPTDTVVSDLVFVARDRLHIVGPKAIEGAPDLIVEVLSPSTRSRDLGVKRELYERHGVREYWVADPVARALTLRVLEGDRYRLVPAEDGRRRSTVIPGLVVDPAALFAAIPALPR